MKVSRYKLFSEKSIGGYDTTENDPSKIRLSSTRFYRGKLKFRREADLERPQ